MIRFTCATILLLVTLFCLTGAIESAWVAGFKDKYYQVYVDRSNLFLVEAVIAFAAFVTVLVWGRTEAIMRVFRKPKPVR